MEGMHGMSELEPVIRVPDELFRFLIRCSVSKPEDTKGDCGRKSRLTSHFLAPVKFNKWSTKDLIELYEFSLGRKLWYTILMGSVLDRLGD